MNATTWRDLADQLTPGQVQHLSRREELLRRGSRHRKDDADIDADLLGDARDHIEGNERDQRFAHIPEPAGAVYLYDDEMQLATAVANCSSWTDLRKSLKAEKDAADNVPADPPAPIDGKFSTFVADRSRRMAP